MRQQLVGIAPPLLARFVGADEWVIGVGMPRPGQQLRSPGVTKPVTVDVEYTGAAIDPFNNQRIGFEGQTTINRKDWGINWNGALDAGGVLVSEKVTLEFEVSAIRTDDAS